MPPELLQERFSVNCTETLAKLVFQCHMARELNLPYNAGMMEQEVTPGIVLRIDGNQWLRSHMDQPALFNLLLGRAGGYPWFAEKYRRFKEFRRIKQQQEQQKQKQQSSSALTRQSGTSQEPSSSASAGQRSTSLPASYSSSASLQPQAQAPSARQPDLTFHQTVQQPNQLRGDYHEGLNRQPQQQSALQPQGRQPQGSKLPPIQGLGLLPRKAQTQYPEGLETTVAPAGRLSFSPATLAQGQAYATRNVAAGARSQMMIPQSVCENCGEDIKNCGCISGDEDQFLIVQAGKTRARIEKMDEKHEQLRATGGLVKKKEIEKKTKLEEDNKRTLRRADIAIQARKNRKARIAHDAAIAESGKSKELNSHKDQHSAAADDEERATSISPQASPTFVSTPAVSEAGGCRMALENSEVRAKSHSLYPSGDRYNHSQPPSPASVRGSASQGQSVLASNRRVTEPSPRKMNEPKDLSRLHRPSHLEGFKKTNESGMDQRSASPRKSEGGKDWRDRRSSPGQDH